VTVDEFLDARKSDVTPARWKAQAFLEYRTLRSFFSAADASGLAIPEDSQFIRRALNEFDEGWDPNTQALQQWPPRELWSILALAQHHGLATRLLDWTTNSATAAYFAASTAGDHHESQHDSDEGVLCVWALDRISHGFAQDAGPKPSFPIQFVTAPSAANDNLRAQRGLFTLVEGYQEQALIPLDEGLPPPPAEAKPYLLRFELPARLAPRLLRHLAVNGVSAATVYPNFDGVVKSLLEQRHWERNPESGALANSNPLTEFFHPTYDPPSGQEDTYRSGWGNAKKSK
jgi:hypothetical protein